LFQITLLVHEEDGLRVGKDPVEIRPSAESWNQMHRSGRDCRGARVRHAAAGPPAGGARGSQGTLNPCSTVSRLQGPVSSGAAGGLQGADVYDLGDGASAALQRRGRQWFAWTYVSVVVVASLTAVVRGSQQRRSFSLHCGDDAGENPSLLGTALMAPLTSYPS
jgi:hypothetical protein